MGCFRSLVRRATIISVTLCLAIVSSSKLFAQADATSIDELDPETREHFRAVHAKWEKAEQAEEAAKQRAYRENPLLKTALEAREYAVQIEEEVGVLRHQTRELIQKRGEDAIEQFEKWEELYSRILEYEVGVELLEDQRWGSLMHWFIEYVIKNRNPQALRDNPQAAIDEQEQEAYVQALRASYDESQPEFQRVNNLLKPPEVAREYVRKDVLSGGLFLAGDTYYRQHLPTYVKTAHEHAGNLADQLRQIWPDWGKAAVAKYERERKEARVRGDSLAQASTKWLWIVVNLAVIAALVFFVAIRRSRLSLHR